MPSEEGAEYNFNIYPDFTDSKFDIRYCKRRILPSDLLKAKPNVTNIRSRGIMSTEDNGEVQPPSGRTYVNHEFTVNLTHSYLACDAADGSFILHLPDANTAIDKAFRVKKIDNTGNTVTVKAFGEQGIDGVNEYDMNVPQEGAVFYGLAGGWERIT